jgi:hypothetical protein
MLGDAGSGVYREAGEFVADDFALAGVHACPDIEPDRCDDLDDRSRAANRTRGTIEGGKEAVSSGVELSTAEAGDLTAGGVLVRLEQVAPAAVPSSAARSVEPTMSVNTTVASTRSGSGDSRTPVKNSRISLRTASAFSPQKP